MSARSTWDRAAAHHDHLVGELDGRRHPVEGLRPLLDANLKFNETVFSFFNLTKSYVT